MKKFSYLCVISMCVFLGLLLSGCETDKAPAGTGNGGDNPSFTLSPSSASITIPAEDKGYTTAPSKQIRVNNTGNTTLKVNIAKSGTNPNDFKLSVNSLELNAGTNKSVSIAPNLNLAAGSYSTVLKFSAEGLESKTITVKFSVTDTEPPEPEDELHIYIAFGQSNMQGPGTIRAKDKTNISERWRILNVVAETYASEQRAKGQWYKAVPPLIIPDSGLTNYLGLSIGLSPADHFGQTLTAGTPENITIGVIAVAHGDMALAAFHKTKADNYYNRTGTLSGRPSNTEIQGMDRYKNAGYTNMYNAIISNVKIAQQQGGIVKGIIVHQGESGVGLSGITWTAMLKEIYDDMLSDLDFEPNSIPILLGQTWNGGDGGSNTGNALNSDHRIQSTLPNAYIISSTDCTGRTGNGQPDNIHFGSEGLELLGTRYGQKMLELVYGITP